ncbi:CAIB/BAIF family enzyme [Cladophialophora carrionii]|uniref:CAIB/BAIF family enzyme n=1 Tax=Cladophialophora carrionii TaxID=86049 RepID=A0A1C1CPF5_9EURO|nr:CAIB/BAIF family enzyme [Cladophialophora carrionii]
MNRVNFRTIDSITHLWETLNLPNKALKSINIPDADTICLPSSFKIGHLAQASITLTALLAALIHSERETLKSIPQVTVPVRHAGLEFKSERLLTINGKPMPSTWGPIGGLHRTLDGYVRLHDSFPNHRTATTKLLGLDEDADREAVSRAIATWKSVDLEDAAVWAGAVVAALRSFEQWDELPHAKAVADFPISITKIADSRAGISDHLAAADGRKRCLQGLRVLELSRVIAAPVAGRTLAAHGADVLWITSPNLPDLPSIDRDTGRGKRTAQLDLNQAKDLEKMVELIDDADVFLQGYRPDSLAARGLSPPQLAARRKQDGKNGIICANLSAYGPTGPWRERRGFDSLVQTCSGMNVSEAEHFGQTDPPAKPMPCQALDHASGYFLAAGILAALYRQIREGGSWQVDVSLAGTMKYLRSLGQYEGLSGFQWDADSMEGVPEEYLEPRLSDFGTLKAARHAAAIEGINVGWDIMPRPLGSDDPSWL